jgi:hypothetical protein
MVPHVKTFKREEVDEPGKLDVDHTPAGLVGFTSRIIVRISYNQLAAFIRRFVS